MKSFYPKVPIIVCSEEDDSKTLIKAIQLGVYDYIKKPFKNDQIKQLTTKLENEFKNSQKENILKEFEKLVLKSSIVTKVDLKGEIKYVNDNFCQLSGFKKDELIGKPFTSIVDKKENIKSLKSIIKNLNNNKFTWKGKVKSINKDGKKVSLFTTMNPLFDRNKNIIGLLAVHIDITFEENLKEHFKNQLCLKTFNLNDALKLNNQYEMAINKSNILSKADTNGKITYVNDKFCEISGYKRSELIGKAHNIIRHKDNRKELFTELWATIKSGKTWKGIIKNKKKDGTAYWVSTTIIPIKDRNNNIKEFIGIKHDLTELFSLHNEIEETQREMLYKMGEVGERRSKETGNHVKRVAQYSKDLALLYGLDIKESNLIFSASPMHDIGKVGIPDDILKKPDKLSSKEFEIMKTHADIGYKILKNSKRPILKVASIIAREHHEKYNGKGYPRGLKGEDIHIYGRITAIADVFDALGSRRYYKEAWPDKKIFDFFIKQRGEHFDPHLVDIFMDNIEIFLKTRDKFQD
ncbi:MAG: PAS domain S-box protein [Halarcobacter sp.]